MAEVLENTHVAKEAVKAAEAIVADELNRVLASGHVGELATEVALSEESFGVLSSAETSYNCDLTQWPNCKN